ncbi:MAG TPA: YggS family pyridoxal phosphate-dependent enzyme [Actinobacteria bacterium]|nr:YggS family pyridoxal phosphate-dependent enzyme [Actinomycetota bacterium]
MNENITENILKIQERISKAALRSGCKIDDIKIVAAIKNIPLEKIMTAIDGGIAHVGENRVRDAVIKFNGIGDVVKWHFIGHLQRNKVKHIIPFTDLIHSVDSLRLAFEIDKQAKKIRKVQKILLEVNVSGEESKFGFSPDDVLEKVKEIGGLGNIKIEGLMTIAPFFAGQNDLRKVFKGLKEVFENIKRKDVYNVNMSYLSMGMTNDFEIAIEEGANMVRIGTGIFGLREV